MRREPPEIRRPRARLDFVRAQGQSDVRVDALDRSRFGVAMNAAAAICALTVACLLLAGPLAQAHIASNGFLTLQSRRLEGFRRD